jgi:aspartyl-tRNA synthetase
MKNYTRTHNCGELRGSHIGSKVTLCGWVHRRRDHGGLLFIDLRDREGITQVVFNPEIASDTHSKAEELRSECVVAVTGLVRRRPEGTENPKLATGEVEIAANELLLLSRAETPPFSIESEEEVGEEVRLKYRFLDLRRPELQRALKLRHRVTTETRSYFDSKGFLEIETPILAKSTPEGARDYLVPSRTQPGAFFALPQSPQLMKQLLMISGVDRYFQICKCFRDEDLRADRQPEFTQIDLEMSFAGEEEVFSAVEGLIARLFRQVLDLEVQAPFTRLTYADALARFGIDKPDLRFGMELTDVTETVKGSAFKAFESVLAKDGVVKGIVAPGGGAFSRSVLDELTAFSAGHGAKGLAWFKAAEEGLESPLAKFFSTEQMLRLREKTGSSTGDLILLVAGAPPAVNPPLSALRNRLGRELGLVERNAFRFAWIVDFPLFAYNEEEKRLESEHHPFTSPKEEDVALLEKEPLKVRAASYDLALNGCELGSGSVRIHDEKLQRAIFKHLSLDGRTIEERFGFFLEAFRYGAPPHAGFALGLDRLVMIMAGRETIRDVIAFPKTQKASCLMTGSPSPVGPEQLRELHVRIGK